MYLNANYLGLLKAEDLLGRISKIHRFLSVATPPSVRAEWAFKIFDSDEDQLLGERDIRYTI